MSLLYLIFNFFFLPCRFQLWESPPSSCQHECQCSCRACPRAHPHARGSSVLAGCHRCRQASQADGQCWQRHDIHGQLHAEEAAAVWQAEEAGHHHSHPSSPGAAVPHAEESHPEGVHQHRRMEISFSTAKRAFGCGYPQFSQREKEKNSCQAKPWKKSLFPSDLN